MEKMKLTSAAFENNGLIPTRYTCDGANVSPTLKLENIPEGTKSLVLIMVDKLLVVETFDHWIIWNITPSPEIFGGEVPEGAICGLNDFGKNCYGGPCPKLGKHKYVFTVYALDKILDLPEGSKKKDVEKAMKEHVLGKATLTGYYKRASA
jgi:Raf kinase inhibitor-like YbhB/YbcL family protein